MWAAQKESSVYVLISVQIKNQYVLSESFANLSLLHLVGTMPSYYAQIRSKGSATKQKYIRATF